MSQNDVRFRKEWARLQQRQDRTRQIVAVHEASHCVLATYLGSIVHWVSIVPERDSLGHCTRETPEYQKLGDVAARVSAVNEILILVGGHVGETLVTRRGLPSIDGLSLSGGRSDHEKAWELVPKILGTLDEDASYKERILYLRVCRSFLNYQIARAYRLIRSEPLRTIVLSLANELLGWEKLSGDQAREVMMGAVNSFGADLQEASFLVCPRNPEG